jgi:hypothetical protein
LTTERTQSGFHKVREYLAFLYYAHGVYEAASGTSIIIAGVAFLKHYRRLSADLFAASLIFLLFLIARRSLERRRVMREFQNPKLEIISWEIIYRVSPKYRKVDSTFQITVRALQDGVDSYRNQQNWAETTNHATIPVSGIKNVHASVLDNLMWTRYEFYFPQPLRKGDVHTVSFINRANLIDAPRTGMHPGTYISKTIDDRFVGPLVLRVILPLGGIVQAQKQIRSLNTRAERAEWSQVLDWDKHTGELRWEVPQRRLNPLKQYCIIWSYNRAH